MRRAGDACGPLGEGSAGEGSALVGGLLDGVHLTVGSAFLLHPLRSLYATLPASSHPLVMPLTSQYSGYRMGP